MIVHKIIENRPSDSLTMGTLLALVRDVLGH